LPIKPAASAGWREIEAVLLRRPNEPIHGRKCRRPPSWFVGDHPDLDVRGAHAAGLQAFWVRTGAFEAPDDLPGRRLERLSDLLNHLDD